MIDFLDVVVNGVFFVAGSALGWLLQRRSGAAAESDRHHLTGELRKEGVRSFAGDDRQALPIAANARATLQHYRTVDTAQRHDLVLAIRSAYTDLAFGTLARASVLSNKMSNELQSGVDEVVGEAQLLGRRRSDLLDLADHVYFVGQIGRAVRATRGRTIPPDGHELRIWDRRCPDLRTRRSDGGPAPAVPAMSPRR